MDNSGVMSKVRPRQVLLVGLGGVGSRTVDKILSLMPQGYKRYVKAIAVDTDLEDLSKRLKHIPSAQQIALGSDPDNGQSVTVGEYIRQNPDTMRWFVKGGHLDTIKKRNTAQGAKQIRMVSRIALAATNDMCGMKKTLEDILQSMNRADGTTLSQGLLVMIVCSIAGGTGAGTVLQFPLYLEQALSKAFADDSVEIQCSMLLPNMFSRVQSEVNQDAARANAYAVIRELMSLNSGRLKRGDVLPDCNFEEKAEYCAPFGRVLFFDDISESGDSIEQDLDQVYVPKVARALNEYLFGPVSGKITSALDNTLAQVYHSKGAAIFGSVGSAKLEYPRMAYMQYVTGQWINKVIADTWLDPDREVEVKFKNALREAIENDTERPDATATRRKLFCETIDSKRGAFYREIKRSYNVSIGEDGETVALADDFWDKCVRHLHEKIENDVKVGDAHASLSKKIQNKNSQATIIDSLVDMGRCVDDLIPYGLQYEIEVMRPMEADKDSFYSKDKDERRIYSYIKEKKLHPIMIRYFLYQLYDKAKLAKEINPGQTVEITKFSEKVSKREFADMVNQEQNNAYEIGKSKIVANFANYLCRDLDEYIKEVEDMFKSFNSVIDFFDECSDRCINSLEKNNPKTGSVLAGGPLSMMYSWNLVKNQMSNGDDVYTIDDDLDLKIHELAYKGFMNQIKTQDKDTSVDGSPIRIRTRYESIVARELQIYYTKILNDSYSHCFPQSVLEAALIECGLENSYKDNLSRADDPAKYTVEYFMNHGAEPLRFESENKTPEGYVSDPVYLNALLAAGMSNAKAYCGRIEGKGMRDHILVANENILRTKIDIDNSDSMGVAGKAFIYDEFIPGVSTSRIGGINVNSKFTDKDISKDEIVFVTTIAALQPSDFVAFLPEDDNEHAPTKGKTYYMSYRNHIDKVSVRDDYITPHLHRDWHLADKLEDITAAHTATYNKDAAIAFVNGFIFNAINVSRKGIVSVGKLNNPYFTKLFEEGGIREFVLMDESELAIMDSLHGVEKRNKFNALFVKVYELLATSQPVRDAVNAYAASILSEYTVSKKADFIRMCLNVNDNNSYYNCILDIVDGYYQGTRALPVKESDGAENNVGYMVNYIFEEVFKMCNLFSGDFATLKELYEKMIHELYLDADCDDEAAEESEASEEGGAEIDSIEMFIRSAVRGDFGTRNKLFTKGQKYCENNAKDLVDHFLNK